MEETSESVILVYQDAFTCGPCSAEYSDLLDFIEHKAQHCLAPGIYKCELCREIHVFQDHGSLVQHYQKEHGILRSVDLNQETIETAAVVNVEETTHVTSENVTKDRTGRMQNNKAVPPDHVTTDNDVTGKRTTPDANHIFVEIVTSDSPETKTVEPEVGSNQSKVRVSSGDATTSLKGEKDCGNVPSSDLRTTAKGESERSQETEKEKDFTFILKHVPMKSRSFSYAKVWFHCFHCSYRTQTRVALVRHMDATHPEMYDMHRAMEVREPPLRGATEGMQGEDRKVMKMSVYEKLFCWKGPNSSATGAAGKSDKSKSRKGVKRKRGVEKQDLPGNYSCPTCQKMFGRLRYLRKHVATHRTERKFLCDECGKGFTTKTYLTHHRKSHVERIFRCAHEGCDFSSNQTPAIHAHRQVHPEGSVLCDICGLAYADKPALVKHKRVHDKSRPFACSFPGCQWRFKSAVMCRAHVRAHTTEGRFQCAVCDYRFRHKHHLQRHEVKVHGALLTKSGGAEEETQVIFQACEAPDVDNSANTVNLVFNTPEGSGVVTASPGDVITHAVDGVTQHYVVAAAPPGAIALESVDVASVSVLGHEEETEGIDVTSQTVVLTQSDQ